MTSKNASRFFGLDALMGLFFFGALFMSGPVLGAPGGAAPGDGPSPYLDVPSQSVLRFSHHGVLRVRPEFLTGSLPLPQNDPLLPTLVDGGESYGFASMRLRYEPSLFIGTSLAIHTGFDVLGNMVLGSSPAYWRNDGFGDADQGSIQTGLSKFQDAFAVRELYLHWRAFEFLDLKVGRMAEHFGLGLLRNDGRCRDCNGGSLVDRIWLGAEALNIKLGAAWEFTSNGLTSDYLTDYPRSSEGQALDLGVDDDVFTYLFKVGQYAETAEEHAARQERLKDPEHWEIEWGVLAAFTEQNKSSQEQPQDSSLECEPAKVLENGVPVTSYDCVRLVPRQLFLARPSFWLKAEHHASEEESLRIELEAALLAGEVRHPQRLFDDSIDDAKDILAFGGELQVEWKKKGLLLGLQTGLFTGDGGDFYRGYGSLLDPDDDSYLSNESLRSLSSMNAFLAHRDHRIDLILFRQILPGLSNAAYVKPYVGHNLLNLPDWQVDARLDLIYAAAMRPSGTPGFGEHWGLEIDASFEMTYDEQFFADLALGVLLPMNALKGSYEMRPLIAIRAILGWEF